MEKAIRKFTSFCAFYAILIKCIVSTLVPVLILTVSYQIVARHMSFIPRFLWTEEICRFALNWLVMFGAALAVRNNDHLDIDILTRLSPRAKKLRFLLVNLIILIISLFFAVYGWGFAISGLHRKSMAAGLSMIWVYISFVVFGVSSFAFQLERIIKYFTGISRNCSI